MQLTSGCFSEIFLYWRCEKSLKGVVGFNWVTSENLKNKVNKTFFLLLHIFQDNNPTPIIT